MTNSPDARDRLRAQMLAINIPALLRPFFTSSWAQSWYGESAPGELAVAMEILELPGSAITPEQVVRLAECLKPCAVVPSELNDEGNLKRIIELAQMQLRHHARS